MLVQAVASGLIAGSIYALIALGFVLIYKSTRVVHFGQGEQLMLGAYLVLVLHTFAGLPFGVAVFLALVVAAVVGVLIDRLVCAPILRTPPLTKIVAMLAVGLILREGTRAALGSNAYPFPFLLSPVPMTVAGALVAPANLAVLGVCLTTMAVLFVVFGHTRVGQALRAACENPTAATLSGISVPFVFSVIWAVASVLAGIAGILIAPLVILNPDMGFVALKGWMAAVTGGFTSLPGAVIGGVLIGVIETLSGTFVSTAVKDATTYALIILVLLSRPSGLFERQAVKKV